MKASEIKDITPAQRARIQAYQDDRRAKGLSPDGIFIGDIVRAIGWINMGNPAHTCFTATRRGLLRCTLEVLEACEIAGIPAEIWYPEKTGRRQSVRQECVAPLGYNPIP